MKGLSPVTRAELLQAIIPQSMIFELFREYLREPPTGENIRTPKEYYKKRTNPGAPDMALAYYVAFSNGVMKGLELAGMVTEPAEKEKPERMKAAAMIINRAERKKA